ncbi:MAG: YcgL domain-containing protein [Pseudomonadota bacterium]
MNSQPNHSMNCFVYAGRKLAEGYLFVPLENDFSRVPEALLQQLGELSLVLELSLEPGRKLARSDPEKVRQALTEVGYFFQPPPSKTPLMPNEQLQR